MRLENTVLEDVKIIHLDVFDDDRGAFAETYDSRSFAALGIDTVFVQDSWSHSAKAGIVRGLHFQIPPRAQTKIVQITRGRVFDVVVDIRRNSPTFGQHAAFDLSAADMKSILVPAGFAHGFCTLEDDTEVTYKMSDHYDPSCYKGILWCDPALSIDWPVGPDVALVSEKDAAQPGINEMAQLF